MEREIAVLTAAIIHKRVIEFTYSPGKRFIEPHALGRSSEGHLLLRAYQIEGASASGEHEHWKLFRLDRAEGVEPTGTAFPGPREGYRQGDRAMKGGIIAQL